jgi:hypothetical protein
MRFLARTSVLMALLLWPLSALAAPPPVVSGVTASLVNGKVHVTWREPANPEDIARYRIYYSHESILQNGGAYDDFESTSANAAEYDFATVPNVSRLYVAVLAVNAANEESPSFGNEAGIDLANGQQASDSNGALFMAPTTTQAAAAADTLRLLSATSISGTGVLLTFSQPVAVRQQDAATALRVTDASGAVLAIRTIVVQGPVITLATDPQQPGIRYFVRAMAVWSQPADAAQTAQLVDAQANVAVFVGATPTGPTTPTQTATPTPAATAAIGMTLNAQRIRGNTYRVIADLSVPQGASQVAAMDMSLSADGGRTYSAPQMLDPTTRQIQLDGMTPGLLVLLVRARTTDGTVYQSNPSGIQIDATSAAAASLAQSRAPLASSGPGLLVLLAASGATMGWKKLRKQTRGE